MPVYDKIWLLNFDVLIGRFENSCKLSIVRFEDYFLNNISLWLKRLAEKFAS